VALSFAHQTLVLMILPTGIGSHKLWFNSYAISKPAAIETQFELWLVLLRTLCCQVDVKTVLQKWVACLSIQQIFIEP
jgi:hypothetical protein